MGVPRSGRRPPVALGKPRGIGLPTTATPRPLPEEPAASRRSRQIGPVSIGGTLAGKHRVERLLGAGVMGIVVAVMHLDLGERRAIVTRACVIG